MNRIISTLFVVSAWSCFSASASAQDLTIECRDGQDENEACNANIFIARCIAEAKLKECQASGRCGDGTTLPCPPEVKEGQVKYCCKACSIVANSSIPAREPFEDAEAESDKQMVCEQALACAGPPPPPGFGIWSQYCGGLHSMHWSQVPGALQYQVQAKGYATYPWSLVPETHNFPGIIVDVGGDQYGCDGDANGDFYARARACNACGCSAWSTEYPFTYFTAECR